MNITRRRFLQYCGASAAVLGLDPLRLGLLRDALANPAAPSVIWLNGSSCSGCTVSLLNHVDDTAPMDFGELVTDQVNLIFHAALMASAGEPAVAELLRLRDAGNFILVLEGGVPMAFGGHCCVAYTYRGQEVTYLQAVQDFAVRARHVIAVGTCAAFGGIPASMSNPTQVVDIRGLTGQPTINLSGCPAHPAWVAWTLAQLLTGQTPVLDADGRPVELYTKNDLGQTVPALLHDKCPLNRAVNPAAPDVATVFGQDGQCLVNLGCRGPFTKAQCENVWNGLPGAGRWCIGVNAPCHGCVERTFPGPESFFEQYYP